MTNKRLTRTLLLEAHSAIATESRRAVSQIGVSLRRRPASIAKTEFGRANPELAAAIEKSISGMTLTYPPEAQPLTSAEETALMKLKLTPLERSAVRKVIADAGAAMIFHLFCLMDAVGDPTVVPSRRWFGASFTVRREGPMLHDEFGDLYWEFKRAMARKASSSSNGSRRTRSRKRAR